MTEDALKGYWVNVSGQCQLCTEREEVPVGYPSGITCNAKVVNGDVKFNFSLVANSGWDMSGSGDLRLYIPDFLYYPQFLLQPNFQLYPVSHNLHARVGTSTYATVRRAGEIMLLQDSGGFQFLRFWLADINDATRGLVPVTFEEPSPWEAGERPSRLIGNISWELG